MKSPVSKAFAFFALAVPALMSVSAVQADFLHPGEHPSKVRYYYDKDGTRHKCHNGTVGGVAGGVGGAAVGGLLTHGSALGILAGAAAGGVTGRSLERHGKHGC